MILIAKAKLNLFLHINGKDQNSYHKIQTLICFTENLYDEIEIEEIAENNHKIEFYGEFAHLVDSNKLMISALNKLALKRYYKIQIKKNIPVGAGLGGGSSDVAAVLKFLIAHENLILSTDEIHNICLQIGTDVNVCYYGKPAFCEGYGEIITPIQELNQNKEVHINKAYAYFAYVIIIYPNIFTSTKEIYSKITEDNYLPKTNFYELKNKVNSLEIASISLHKEIQYILEALAAQNGCELARMSGSGSACFGLFHKKNDLEIATIKLKELFPSYWFHTDTISL